ncbi:MAG: zinc ribbon protein [Clostridiales bacterium]|jgi:putative FmdB family regulatory protein|nr:zinc ribbon protein [Clostridiales bacterium]
MALIDFKCKNCGKEFFEIINKDGEKVFCPECSGENVEKVYKGKFYGKSGSCSGSCSGCSGCH